MDPRSLAEFRAAFEAGPPYDAQLLEELRLDGRAGAQSLYRRCLRCLRRVERERERVEALMAFDDAVRAQGFDRVGGVDEAGRGPLAGPIVAGAVVLAGAVDRLNDSKQLKPEEREALFAVLREGRHDIGVGVVDAPQIDRIGIQRANYLAMAQAVAALKDEPDFLLVDGRHEIPGVRAPQRPVVKGDSRSLSIAAASIVAKVTRDRMMAVLDREYPAYGFGTHKGYATSEHVAAIARCGPCLAHRKSFAPMARPMETGELF